ncbi:hypothetical protein SAMD00023353_2401400 [Rosellinia necatrix]|uniref:Mitochondrial intermembrane space import and assembly protein 40 n=1 Tax=Rosellinia necatrix TaxID=77044 RepID=A0A1W2TFX0_ROSNE|nr:hypothetical protein SAMD00023353_2401400 [Rosellinia necatrix]
MYRAALRSTPRIASPLRRSCVQSSVAASGRRFASTVPADKKRGWKSSAARWGLAIGALYWYSTSTAFAEEPKLKTIQPPPQFSDDDLPTIEAVVARKRQEAEARAQKAAGPESKVVPELDTTALAAQTSPEAPANEVEADGQAAPAEGSPEALEQEASQQGAFNPETGEINWDCPCLGGMAHGPCGEEFKAAFSCFVYSKEEPKGMDCIDKFQHMQDCFRLHPEIYGEELADDDEAAAAADAAAPEGVLAKDAPAEDAAGDLATQPSSSESTKAAVPTKEVGEADVKTEETKSAGEKAVPTSSSSSSPSSSSSSASKKPSKAKAPATAE